MIISLFSFLVFVELLNEKFFYFFFFAFLRSSERWLTSIVTLSAILTKRIDLCLRARVFCIYHSFSDLQQGTITPANYPLLFYFLSLFMICSELCELLFVFFFMLRSSLNCSETQQIKSILFLCQFDEF